MRLAPYHGGTAVMESAIEYLSAARIESNAARIAPYIRRTPTLAVDGADFGLAGVRLVFKLEFLQHAGSFKTRGAFTNMLSRTAPTVGVVAASGGNHGAAVAFAAMRLSIPATIFVPSVASAAKLEQIRAYGAKLHVVGERYADALAASEEFIRTSGAMGIHAFDQLETLLGQASVGLEFEQDAPNLDALLVSVGGGGLIGGIAAWYRDRTALIGVEPALAPTLTNALQANEPVDAPAGGIAAESLAPRRVGSFMFPIAQQFVRTVLVEDDAILEAQRALWRVLRIVSESGGAAAFAAVLSRAWQAQPGQTIGILLCGANTSAVTFN
jgi:threonine dehydratase